MKRVQSSHSPTPAGGAMVVLLIAAVVLVLFGPKHDEAPAFIVIAVIVAIFVVGAFPGGFSSRARQQRTLLECRDRFHPGERDPKGAPEGPADEPPRGRERERRDQSQDRER